MLQKTFTYADGICSGICDNHTTAIVSMPIIKDGKNTVKIQPTPEGSMARIQNIIVDALELSKYQIDLEKYEYIIIEYKYDCLTPLYNNRMGINIMRSNIGLKKSVGVYSNDKIVSGKWERAIFNIGSAVKKQFTEGSHILNQFHLFPFGSVVPNELSKNDIIYIGNITFTTENPEPDKKYIVSFTNGGIKEFKAPDEIRVKPGETFIMPECNFSCPGIKFCGWQYNMADYMTSGYVTSQKINTYLKPGDAVEMPYDDLVFFPRWQRILTNSFPTEVNNNSFEQAQKKLSEIEELSEKRKNEIRTTEDKVSVNGTKYYVSADGDDNNDGKSPQNAWKTISKVNCAKLSFGDGVFFKRGEIFRGNMITQNGVTYAAYGNGEKPKITSSEENGSGEEKWILVNGTNNIWKYHKQFVDIGGIVVDRGNGEFICEKELAFLDVANQSYYKKSDKSEFFNPITDLKNLTFFNFTKSKDVTKDRVDLYFRCDDGNPGKIFKSIEFLDGKSHAIVAKSDVTIDNLCVLHSSRHGIGTGSCKNLIITNCEIGWIGGGLFGCNLLPNGILSFGRYGNGVEVYGACDNYVIDNCYVYQCFDAGITNQLQKGGINTIINKNVRFSNNLIEYCCYNIEYFMGIGDAEVTRLLENVIYENNICRMAGFGWGRANPTNSAHIKGWDHRNESKNFVIRNNIFDRAYGDLLHIGATQLQWLPIVEGNTYIQYKNSLLGHIGPNPTQKYLKYMYAEDIVYDENVTSFISDILCDKTAEVYFLDKLKK